MKTEKGHCGNATSMSYDDHMVHDGTCERGDRNEISLVRVATLLKWKHTDRVRRCPSVLSGEKQV